VAHAIDAISLSAVREMGIDRCFSAILALVACCSGGRLGVLAPSHFASNLQQSISGGSGYFSRTQASKIITGIRIIYIPRPSVALERSGHISLEDRNPCIAQFVRMVLLLKLGAAVHLFQVETINLMPTCFFVLAWACKWDMAEPLAVSFLGAHQTPTASFLRKTSVAVGLDRIIKNRAADHLGRTFLRMLRLGQLIRTNLHISQ
jgi:hypothetical protein